MRVAHRSEGETIVRCDGETLHLDSCYDAEIDGICKVQSAITTCQITACFAQTTMLTTPMRTQDRAAMFCRTIVRSTELRTWSSSGAQSACTESRPLGTRCSAPSLISDALFHLCVRQVPQSVPTAQDAIEPIAGVSVLAKRSI